MASILGTTVGLMIAGAIGGFMALLIQDFMEDMGRKEYRKGIQNFIIKFIAVILLGGLMVWLAQARGWL